MLHEDASERLAVLPAARLPTSVCIVVGPEGGIADDELAAFRPRAPCRCGSGEPVLRTSTAGAAALAALSVRLGRWALRTVRS